MAKKEEEFTNPANMFLSGNSQQENTKPETGHNTTPQQDAGQPTTQPNIPAGYRLVKETKSERMQLLVPPRLKEGIEAAAKREGTSANSLINMILMDYLERGN